VSQHNLKCSIDTLALCELEYHFVTAPMPDVQIGDLVRLIGLGDDGQPLAGKYLMREVAQVRHTNEDSDQTKLTLVPLDHPPMRQIQITNPTLGTFVCWIGSHAEFEVGSKIRLLGDLTWWTVQYACTWLPVRALPTDARIGFLSEVYP
jgi:hypothetical protein